MQVHVIPVPHSRLAVTLSIFLATANTYKLKFSEVGEQDGEVDDVVVHMQGGPYQEYFYIELPVGSSTHSDSEYVSSSYKKFVYVHADQTTKFPMHFGVEVAAKILDEPHKAQWKNCIVPEQQEVAMAEKFKTDFAEYDFTLS